MAPLSVHAIILCTGGGLLFAAACSPEATRVRDGGPGADPGNKRLVEARIVNPRAADTTLWPGRAPTPAERLSAGTMPPPHAPEPSAAEQRAFTKSATDPRTGPEPRRR